VNIIKIPTASIFKAEEYRRKLPQSANQPIKNGGTYRGVVQIIV
jgi:hypothetical protein